MNPGGIDAEIAVDPACPYDRGAGARAERSRHRPRAAHSWFGPRGPRRRKSAAEPEWRSRRLRLRETRSEWSRLAASSRARIAGPEVDLIGVVALGRVSVRRQRLGLRGAPTASQIRADTQVILLSRLGQHGADGYHGRSSATALVIVWSVRTVGTGTDTRSAISMMAPVMQSSSSGLPAATATATGPRRGRGPGLPARLKV